MLRAPAAGVGLLAASAFLPAQGLAQEQPAGERRVAVLILATGEVDAETADSLTELVIGEVAGRGGVRIIGKEELQAQLGQGEQRSIECVSSAACLGRVGVELGVDEVIAGTVALRGATWIFNVNRIEIRSGQLAGRAFREVEGDLGQLADALVASIPSLYEAPREATTLLIATSVEGAEIFVDGALVGVYRGDPVRVDDVAPGRHEVTVSAPGHLEWTRAANVQAGTTLQLDASLEPVPVAGDPYVSPLVYIGGAVAILGGGAATYFGLSSKRDPDPDLNRAEAVEFVDDRERAALFANIGFAAIAAGVLTLGLGLLLSDFDGEPASVRAGVTPAAGGAMLDVEGTF